jgi:hypothetical protein
VARHFTLIVEGVFCGSGIVSEINHESTKVRNHEKPPSMFGSWRSREECWLRTIQLTVRGRYLTLPRIRFGAVRPFVFS